jgi:hypothetical protein
MLLEIGLCSDVCDFIYIYLGLVAGMYPLNGLWACEPRCDGE